MKYRIEYLDKGQIKEITISASNVKEAIEKLKYKNLGIGVILDIKEQKTKSIKEFLEQFLDFSKVDLEEYISLLEQIYVMLDAGIGIDLVLNNLLSQIKNKRLKEIFTSIANDIKAGISLTDAFKKFEIQLGTLSVAMIKLGEETGDLSTAIRDLAIILSEILDNRKRLKKATKYPMFIIFAMMISFVIVIIFVIPPFKSIFEQMETELPLPTRFLLWLDNAFSKYGVFVISGAILIFVSLSILYAKNPKIRLFLDEMILKIYILGDVIKLAMIGRFTYVLQRLIDSGIPIVDSVDIALNIIENSYIKKKLSIIKRSIATGGTITQGFKESQIFEDLTIHMISAGEESGSIVEMLKKVSKYYTDKYKTIVDNISVLIEPILIAAIAGFIFTMALGIFLPMWDLTQTVK